MTSLELDLFLAVPSSEFNTYWIPCTWFINLLKEARQNHRIPDPQGLKLVMEVLYRMIQKEFIIYFMQFIFKKSNDIE